MERYLSEHAEEGTVDSQGTFTLNLTRAFQQMSRRVSRHPYDFLLRAVQAAVAGQADKVLIELDSSLVSLSFGVDLSPLGQLTTWLGADPEVEPSRAQKHLAAALLMAPAHWTLRLADGSLTREGDGLAQGEQTSPGVSWTISHFPYQANALRAYLEEHLAFCPIRVGINGSLLGHRWPRDRDRSGLYGPMDLSWSLQVGTGGEGFALTAPPLDEFEDSLGGWRVWRGQRGWFCWPTAFPGRRPAWLLQADASLGRGPLWKVRRAVRDTGGSPHPGSLRLVLDGVALQPRPLKPWPGREVVQWAPWATTDLSGMEVVENDTYHSYLEELSSHLQAMDKALIERAHRVETVRRGKARGGDPRLLFEVLKHALSDLQLSYPSRYNAPEPPGYLYVGLLLRRGALGTFVAWDHAGRCLVTLHVVPNEPHFLPRARHFQERDGAPREVELRHAFVHRETFYLVTPFLSGTSLPRLLRKAPPGERERLLAEAVEAVVELHQQRGHGGLTPGRFHLEEGGRMRILPNLADLLLSFHGPGAAESLERFAAPELRRGEGEESVDRRRADAYSLGMLLRTALIEPEPRSKAVPPPLTEQLASLIEALIQEAPDQRPDDLARLAQLLRAQASLR